MALLLQNYYDSTMMAELWWQHFVGLILMTSLWWQHYDGSTMIAALWWQHSDGSTMMAALSWQHFHGSTMIAALWWHNCDNICMMASLGPQAPFTHFLFIPAFSEPCIFWAQYQTQQFTVTSSGPGIEPISALLQCFTLLYKMLYYSGLGVARLCCTRYDSIL